MTKSFSRRVSLALLLFTAASAAALFTAPRAQAADADDCGGRSMTMCKSIKSCVSINGGPFSCTTDFYYYPDAA